MREMLLAVAVLVGGCTPRTCEESCAGCCDGFDECHPGTTDTKCGSGGKFCTICTGAVTCSASSKQCTPRGMTGGGAGGGTGGGVSSGGGAGGGGGGAVEPSVFVTLRFDNAQCCTTNCGTCRFCTPLACTVTKAILASRFQQLRTGSLSSCLVTQTATDGYDADCTAKCTTRPATCVLGGFDRSDTVISCASITGTLEGSCTWTP